MADNNDTQAAQHSSEPDSTLKPLDVLVGEWDIEIASPLVPGLVRGSVVFEWLKGGGFLVERWDVANPDFPDGIALIGYDESTGNFQQHYFDTRGVSRIYDVSLSDGVLTLSREDPDFAQRYVGTFSDEGNTISGYWEIAEDGTKWEHDFDLTYKKVKAT